MVSGSSSMSESDRPPVLLRGGAPQDLRFLGGDNNNNNNNNQNNNNQNNNKNQNQNNNKNQNQNNNNNQNQNQWQGNQNGNANYYNNNNMNLNSTGSYAHFNGVLFTCTVVFCAVVTVLVFLRMKFHRKSAKRRKRLGLPPPGREVRKRSKSGDDDADNIITDEEIHRYVLPSKQEQSIRQASNVVRCDRETDQIMDLCKPFWFEAFVSGICDVLNTALVGKALGVDALAIYYIVTVPTAFTHTIIGAVLETVSSLGAQAIGVGSYKLTGQYCQISIILYTILFIPHAMLWMACLKPTLRWFAPNLGEEVIDEGYNYFLVGLVGTYIESYSTVLHSLLEVTDHYQYGMKSGVVHNIVGVLGFWMYVKINPGAQKSIVWVEVIWTVMALAFVVIDVFVTKHKRWFDDFWKGMLRSVAMKNWQAVWLVLKTAAPLAVGNIIMTIEWELLAIFAASIGGIEVAAWGIVGTIWGILEYATACVASAGEIRVAKLLGNGNPRLAKLSAYKCLFLGNTFATLMSVGFIVGLPLIPGWFTDDEELQFLVASVLPYCAVGNLTLTIGSLAWTLVGAQGRYNVATYHGCIGSLMVTIPFAAIAIYWLHWGLPALAASVVIGYMTSGAFNSITLFLSDWEYISYRVMIRNGATEPVEEEDDERMAEGFSGRWNIHNYMKNTVLVDDGMSGDISGFGGKGTVLVDTLNKNRDSCSDEDDDSKTSCDSSLENEQSISTSWWATLGFDQQEGELREVVIGPGKLGYTIQSTKEGPMIVGCPEDLEGSFLDMIYGSSHQARRAKIITGDLFLGDIIVQVDRTRTDKMSGREIATLLHRKQNREFRRLRIGHREGTGLATVYQPGPYGSAAIAGVLENSKQIEGEEFEDDGVFGEGYFKMGWAP